MQLAGEQAGMELDSYTHRAVKAAGKCLEDKGPGA